MLPTTVNLDDVALGNGGFKIIGEDINGSAGVSVASPGDVNGDGFDDLLIGASSDVVKGFSSGSAYVVFGQAKPPTTIDLKDVKLGTGGFKLAGETVDDIAGKSVETAGDIDGDGFDDLIIGAKLNDEGGAAAGASYIVYGANFSGAVTQQGTGLGETFTGTAGVDVIVAGQGGDLLVGGGGADVLRAGAGFDDIFLVDNAFAKIDGGSGQDCLVLNGGVDLDFTGIGDTRVEGIENIDFFGAGQSTITLESSDIRAMSDTGTLTVSYDTDETTTVANDNLVLAGDWTFGGSTLSGGDELNFFTDGATELHSFATTMTATGTLSIDASQTLLFGGTADILSVTDFLQLGNSVLTVETGILRSEAGSTVDVSSGGTVAIAGTGTFDVQGTLFAGLSPGSMHVEGDFSFASTSFYEFELGGLTPGVHDGHDLLTVSSEFALGGTVNTVEFGGFEVSEGDSFNVINAGTLSGSFHEINDLDVGGGVVLDAIQTSSDITLVAKAVTHQGDGNDNILTGTAG
ncbi:MAG: integrin alpha, partial [Alphaproteobacteria bacterium]